MWIYLECLTDSTCLAASEESPLPCKNGSSQSPTVKSTPIVKESSYLEWQMENYTIPQSGMTLKVLDIEHYCTPQSILFMGDFHARISVLQEMERDWKEREALFFLKSCDCVAKLSQDTSFWKTCQLLPIEGEQKWSGKFPRWGMVVGGVLYPLHRAERYIEEKGGFFLPTPTANSNMDCPSERNRKSPALNSVLNQEMNTYGLKTNPRFLEWMMKYPFNWTELEPWVMQWFHNKPKKPLKSCQELNKNT